MLVQDFLRGGGTLAQLTECYSISAKRHTTYPNLVLLKYSMIDSPMHEPIVRECRGVILDEADGWRAISRGFDKFSNHLEATAAKIDWSILIG